MSTSNGQGGRGGNDRGRGPHRPLIGDRELRRLRRGGSAYNDLITTFGNDELRRIANEINNIYGATERLTNPSSNNYFLRNITTGDEQMVRMLEVQLVVIRALGRLTAAVRQQIPIGSQGNIRGQLPIDDRFTTLADYVQADIDEIQRPQQFNPAGGQPLVQLPPAPQAGPALPQGLSLGANVPNLTLPMVTNSLN